MGYRQNATVQWLLTRARGQGGIVSLPETSEPVVSRPIGDFPPGVQPVLNYLIDAYGGWRRDSKHLDWCLLVGGPGNGKSEALRTLAQTLDVSLPSRRAGQPALRTLPSAWPAAGAQVVSGLEIVFVNDASIPRDDLVSGGVGSLCLDIAGVLERTVDVGVPTVLFANINRGVLIEEVQQARAATPTRAGTQGLALELLEWVQDPPGIQRDSKNGWSDRVETVSPVRDDRPFFGRVRLTLEGWTIDVHVVFLDALSLLEPTPLKDGVTLHFEAGDVEVAPYWPFGGLSAEGATRGSDTIAGSFLAELVEETRWEDSERGCWDSESGELCDAYEVCPFVHNARWVRSSTLRGYVLDVLRAAEVHSGRNLTYRDLIASYSRALLGDPEDSWLSEQPARAEGGDNGDASGHPCRWVERVHRSLMDGGEGGAAEVAALVEHRIYSNLFPTFDPDGWQRESPGSRKEPSAFGVFDERSFRRGSEASGDPFQASLGYVDPAADLGEWGGARRKALGLVSALDVLTPADELKCWPDVPDVVVTEIERQLDLKLQAEIRENVERSTKRDDSRNRLLRRRRSVLFLRQVALALGHVGHEHAVRAWLEEQARALHGGNTEGSLARGLHELVFPDPKSYSTLFLAPLRPRTRALDEPPREPTILAAVDPKRLLVDLHASGDALEMVISLRQGHDQKPKRISRLVVDLQVAREALLRGIKDRGSFTEVGDDAFARIERARASLVRGDSSTHWTLCFADGGGRILQVEEDPTPAATYRIRELT